MEFTTGDSTGDDAEVLCLVFIVVRSTEIKLVSYAMYLTFDLPK